MKFALLLLLLPLSISHLYGQDFVVPDKYELKTASDYTRYQDDVLKDINWLESSPINVNTRDRDHVTKFLIAWISGSPKESIVLRAGIAGKLVKYPDLFTIFMVGWARHSINTGEYKNELANTKAAVEDVIEFYNKNSAYIEKNKLVEKYIKLREKGKLESYIQDQINKG